MWRAYEALWTCRTIGTSVGPIPWTAVNEYAIRYGYEGDGFERLSAWLRRMEAAADE